MKIFFIYTFFSLMLGGPDVLAADIGSKLKRFLKMSPSTLSDNVKSYEQSGLTSCKILGRDKINLDRCIRNKLAKLCKGDEACQFRYELISINKLLELDLLSRQIRRKIAKTRLSSRNSLKSVSISNAREKLFSHFVDNLNCGDSSQRDCLEKTLMKYCRLQILKSPITYPLCISSLSVSLIKSKIAPIAPNY
jgi:hypothetical protein